MFLVKTLGEAEREEDVRCLALSVGDHGDVRLVVGAFVVAVNMLSGFPCQALQIPGS